MDNARFHKKVDHTRATDMFLWGTSWRLNNIVTFKTQQKLGKASPTYNFCTKYKRDGHEKNSDHDVCTIDLEFKTYCGVELSFSTLLKIFKGIDSTTASGAGRYPNDSLVV